jgi:ketosteroid isomerase-like protein
MNSLHSEIEVLLTAYHDAVVTKDIEKMLSLYTDNVRIFDTWEHWEANGELWREMIVK